MLSACGSVALAKPDDADAEAIRGVVLKAAFDELVDRGIDRFTVDRVAKRAGVEPDVIIAMWGDRRILLMDAVLSSSESVIPIPDTGTLRGDLALAFEAAVTIASTREGRRQLYSMLPRGRDFDPTEVQRVTCEPPPRLRKGDELGVFHLGSTVVLVTERGTRPIAGPGPIKVRFGQAILQGSGKP